MCATVDQRAVANAREVCQVFALNRGIMVHCNTSVYIAMNEDRTKFRKEYACIRNIYTVDVFPNYAKIHHQASPSIFVL